MSFFRSEKKSQNLGAHISLIIATVIAASTGTAVYAQSDDEISAELEALVDAAQSPEAAIAAAREQIAANDLSGAASTLERALLVNRNADDVRALYAVTLCRLDDPQGAAVEIDLLKGRNIPPEFATELRTNCGLTPGALGDGGANGRGAEPDSAVWGSFSMGIAYDSDSVGATNLQFISPLFLRLSQDALAVTGSLDLNARAPLGSGGGGWVYAGISADARFEAFGPSGLGNGNNDYQAGEIRLGYGNRSDNSEFEIGPLKLARWCVIPGFSTIPI